ncbi:zinc finger protein 575-like [Penaeus indicus]|uniref:zinc finger protein 575-like n=1 Tax=Penaeus indicus TaxID=29960 RepID=UPI00300D4CDF
MQPEGRGAAADSPAFPPHLGSLWTRVGGAAAGGGSPALSLPEMMAVRGLMGGMGGLVGGMGAANPSLGLLPGFPPPFQLTPGLVPDFPAKFGSSPSFPNSRLGSLLSPALATPPASLAPLPPPPATPEPAMQGTGDQSKENPASVRPLKCINCEYVTTDMTTLLDHLDSHYSVRTFLCVHCTRAFPGPRELHAHNQPGQCPYRET